MESDKIDDDVTFASKTNTLYDIFKRIFDIVSSCIVSVFAIPMIILFSLLIRIETPGKAIYTQSRLGKDGKEFTIFKLRSMYNDAECNGAQWADKHDLRVTKVGKLIRLTRIDELPQLFNVLMGDMSIVGPRPERPLFVSKFIQTTPGFAKRMIVKPGLTGWAQVNGGYDLTPEEKLKYDLYYINHRGIKFDILILLRTIKVIITGQGAR